MTKIIVHRASGSQLTLDTRSGEGLRVFLHRAQFKTRDAVSATPADVERAKKILAAHETSSQEDIRWARRVLSRGESGDSSGAFMRPGSHKPETRAKNTPIADAGDTLFPMNARVAVVINGNEQLGKIVGRAEGTGRGAENYYDIKLEETGRVATQIRQSKVDLQ